MAKILMGLVAATVIAVGVFFGFEFYMQHRVAAEIEAAFEQIRAAGGKASHGKVSFDLLTRTVTVADIAGESSAQTGVSVKIARVTASDLSQPDPGRFSADSIDITDIEVDVAMPTETLLRVTYRAPRIAVKDYSGPAGVQRLPASSSLVDLYRFGFEQLAIMEAASIVAPRVAATMKFSAAMQGGGGDGDFTYSGLAIEGMKDGKIASAKADDLLFTFVQPAGMTKRVTGNLANFVTHDTDFNVMAAIYDPQKANDDRYYRVYREISAGIFTLKSDQGLNMRIEGFSVGDVAMRPSRLQLPALMAMTPPGAAPPTPAQAREMMQKAAGVYEGVRIGNAEMRGLALDTPQGPLKLSAIRFNLENGKIGEFAVEGLDTRAPNGPVKIERFALKSLDISNLMRMAAQFSNPAQRPPSEQALGMIALLEGAEVKGLVAPYKNTGKPVNIDLLSLDWGQFVGPIPSKARLAVKMSGPFDATDPNQKMLIAAGIDTAAIDFDLGAAWAEAPRTFLLEPVTLELGGVLKASARVSLVNVPREVFSVDPAQATSMAAQIEAGTMELTLRDLGGIDLAIAQYARARNVSRDAARHAIVDNLSASGATTGANPDAVAVVEALTRFIENSGQTLIIKLTPLGKVPALQLIQLLQSDPLIALAQFRIEASTGL